MRRQIREMEEQQQVGGAGKKFGGKSTEGDFMVFAGMSNDDKQDYIDKNYQEMLGYGMRKNSGSFAILMYFVEEMLKLGQDVRTLELTPNQVLTLPDLVFTKEDICDR